MNGQLQVFYKDGEIRNVNLHDAFFAEEELSIASRATDLAYKYNPNPWKVSVTRDGVTKFQKTFEQNMPDNIREANADNYINPRKAA